jgi:DNA polymerase
LLSAVAGQNDKLEEFRSGRDPYVGVAEAFCGHVVTKESHPVLRQAGKVVELQAGYGSGGPKIEATLRRFRVPHNVGDGEAWKTAYRDTHPAVTDLWKQATRMIARLAGGDPIAWGPVTVEGGKITLPNGAPCLYADLHYYKDDESGESYWRHRTRHGWAKLYGAKLVENLIQALARVVISQAMVRLNRLGYRPLNMKHDAIWYALPIDRAEEHARVIMTEMCRVPGWMPGLPLGAEGKPTQRFGK